MSRMKHTKVFAQRQAARPRQRMREHFPSKAPAFLAFPTEFFSLYHSVSGSPYMVMWKLYHQQNMGEDDDI